MAYLTEAQIHQFHTDGFLVLPNLLDADRVHRLAARVDPLFAGEFETGMYPDEWHWNPYLGLPNASAQMTGVWKCDRTMAAVLLSATLGQICAELGHWQGTRLLGDALWMKPCGAGETTLHQDSMYICYHTPTELVTCWMALSYAAPGGSTIEYVRGSHRWPASEAVPEFHAIHQSYRAAMEQAAQQAGVAQPEVVELEVTPGTCVFHHGNTWHGSGKNLAPGTVRRSLVGAYIPAESRFKPTGAYVPGGYIAGRYKRFGDDSMDESFFPILWQRRGDRTPFLATYGDDPLSRIATTV